MVVMTMIGRVIDGLPLAASTQSDQEVSWLKLFKNICGWNCRVYQFHWLSTIESFSEIRTKASNRIMSLGNLRVLRVFSVLCAGQ